MDMHVRFINRLVGKDISFVDKKEVCVIQKKKYKIYN